MNKNYTFLRENVPKSRFTLLQGGTRSGKTYSVLHYIIWFCSKYSGAEIDIVRDTYTSLRSTVMKDFFTLLKEWRMYDPNNHNKTESVYVLNGNIISFYGADNFAKIHGRSRDILFINEAQQFPSEVVSQLFVRTRRRIICDFNPDLGLDHWLDSYIDKYPPIITTYKDNPFLTSEQIKDIEEQMERSQYFRDVYGNGIRGKREGAIYTNIEEGDFDTSLPFMYGLDFGSTDPTALVKVSVDSKRRIIYVKEELYAQGLSAFDLVEQVGSICGQHSVICDSASPQLITTLKQAKLRAFEASKGQGSVLSGITKIQGYKIVFTGFNIRKELYNYAWNVKQAIPFDRENHLMDAMRYAFDFMTKNSGRSYSGKNSLI